MRVILEVIESEQEDLVGKRFVFQRHEAFVVGRKKNEKVQFRIPSDRRFSRYHFIIEISPPHCFIRDLGSTNGTWVNGERIRDASLKDGDVIRGGRTEMRVRIEEPEPAATFPSVGHEHAPPNGRPPQQTAPPPAPLATAPPQEVGAGMGTDLFGNAPSPGGPAELRCAICHRLAEDTQIDGLTETRMIAYICPDCRQEHRDPDQPVPNYEKLAVLGRGAMGPVYKARRISTGKLVALQVISPEVARNPQAATLFLRQMQLVARLEHPKIVPIIEMGQAGDDLWIASEFVDGVNARELARQLGGTVPPADAVDIVCQALEALDFAHGLNLVHRDVKPSNILVAGRPGAYAARLADFGLIRNMDEAGVSGITRKGEVRGTVPFMPPEQILDCRFVKPAGDVYAAGATLYWLLTGELAYDFEARDRRGEKMDPYLIIMDEKVQMVPIRDRDPSVPEPLARAIQTALAYEPEDRFETAAEMGRALRDALG